MFKISLLLFSLLCVSAHAGPVDPLNVDSYVTCTVRENGVPIADPYLLDENSGPLDAQTPANNSVHIEVQSRISGFLVKICGENCKSHIFSGVQTFFIDGKLAFAVQAQGIQVSCGGKLNLDNPKP